jgi:hypothetical protein
MVAWFAVAFGLWRRGREDEMIVTANWTGVKQTKATNI